jgi:hypothetical protein
VPDEAPRHSAFGYGAVFAQVRVDPALGEVRVARLTAAYAAGRILNPLLARSQFIGGLIGGIGMAPHEATVMDARLGRIVNDNLADYLIPVHATCRASTYASSTRLTPTLPAASRVSACSVRWAPRQRLPTPSSTRPGGASATCRSASSTVCFRTNDAPLYSAIRRPSSADQ